jgi:hypothetical protein
MSHRVDRQKCTEILEEPAASIFRVDEVRTEKAKQCVSKGKTVTDFGKINRRQGI